MERFIRPGMTTRELDAIGAEVLDRYGAASTPMREYDFPGHTCISVNDEAVHGVPGDRIIHAGDLVKIDVEADLNGYVTDAARTVVVSSASRHNRLAACARSAFRQAMKVSKAGNRIRDIGKVVEREITRSGYSVIRQLCGHGVGRKAHEPPSIPNYDEPKRRERLTEGLVMTVEPIIAAGSGHVFAAGDGWTLRTLDGSLSAHHEETIVITRAEPILLTTG